MTSSRSFRRVLSDVRRHPWLHVLSILTVTAALVVLGLFFLCHRNFVAVAKRSVDRSVGLVYLKPGVAPVERDAVEARLRAMAEVRQVRFKNGGTVQAELAQVLGDREAAVDPQTAAFFPELFELELAPGLAATQVEEIRKRIAAIASVEEVDLSEQWAVQYQKARSFLDLLGVLFVLVVGVGCALVIANFMGLRHQARKEEISVVQLFGGTQPFVVGPFILEGVLEGVLGAIVALVTLGVVQSGLSALVKVRWSTVLGLEQWLFLSPSQTALLVTLGVGMATFGSLSVFLKLRSHER